MKIKAEVDCTPAEMRELMGLPDLRELQTGAVKAIEKQVIENVERLSSETMLQNWFNTKPGGLSGMQDLFSNLLAGGIGNLGAKKSE